MATCPECGAPIAFEGEACGACAARARARNPLGGFEPDFGDERDATSGPHTSGSPPWAKWFCRRCKAEVGPDQELCDACAEALRPVCLFCHKTPPAEGEVYCTACSKTLHHNAEFATLPQVEFPPLTLRQRIWVAGVIWAAVQFFGCLVIGAASDSGGHWAAWGFGLAIAWLTIAGLIAFIVGDR